MSFIGEEPAKAAGFSLPGAKMACSFGKFTSSSSFPPTRNLKVFMTTLKYVVSFIFMSNTNNSPPRILIMDLFVSQCN